MMSTTPKANPNSLPPERTPVIVGIGEFTDRPEAGSVGLEPLQLLEHAVRRAADDAGRDWLGRIQAVHLVNQWGWKYRDLPGLLARSLGLDAVETLESPVGGNMPVKLMLDAAARIAAGDGRTVVICGAEATASKLAAAKAKQTLPWTPEDPTVPRISSAEFVDPQATRYGLKSPVDVYPLYDNACRAAWRQTFAEAQAESGEIGARMAEAAADNPYAWLSQSADAAEIARPSPRNRMVIHPYTKLMIANPVVNQGAAFIVTTLAEAQAAGISADRLVYIWSGAGGNEPQDFMARDRYDRASAMDTVLKRTLSINGLQADELPLVELYSCFPCVPKLARRSLGLPADQALSVTGGLVFFGAPANNYISHAICAMTRAIRAGRGSHGLVYGNGEFVTKHHAAVLSATPPNADLGIKHLDLQAELDAAYGPVPELVADHIGESTIETYTVMYDRDGRPDYANVVARCGGPAGARHLARVARDDVDTLAWLTDGLEEPVGQTGLAYPGDDGLTHFKRKNP